MQRSGFHPQHIFPLRPQQPLLNEYLKLLFLSFLQQWRASLFLVPCLVAVTNNPDKINPRERTIPSSSQLQAAGYHHRELKAAGAGGRCPVMTEVSRGLASAWCTFSVLTILFTYLLFMCRCVCMCVPVDVYICKRVYCVHVYEYICICVHCVCVYVNMYMCVHVYVYM